MIEFQATLRVKYKAADDEAGLVEAYGTEVPRLAAEREVITFSEDLTFLAEVAADNDGEVTVQEYIRPPEITFEDFQGSGFVEGWKNLVAVHGEHGAGTFRVLCGWRDDGQFFAWTSAEDIAEQFLEYQKKMRHAWDEAPDGAG